MNRRANAVLLSLLTAVSSPSIHAQQTVEAPDSTGKPFWEVVIGPFAVHWSNSDEHKHVFLLGIERTRADNVFWGFSAFSNSFGQPSAYAYVGYRWDGLFGNPALYAKISGGVLYGYKDEHAHDVPFNHEGFGLGIIPVFGYQVTPKDAVQIGVLGAAGFIFTYNRRF
jgi:hypothetical protein